MNNFIKNNFKKIIIVFLLLQPLLDIITNLCINLININIDFIIRIPFLIILMYSCIFVYKKKFSLFSYFIFFTYSIFYLIGVIIYKDSIILYELYGLLKLLYFPIVLISFYDLKDEFKISKMTLFTILLIYLFLILLSNIIGLNFLNIKNDITGIILVLTPIMFIIIKDLKNKILKIIFIITYLIVILMLNTKIPLLVLLITLGFTYLYYIIYFINKKSYKQLVIIGLLLIISISGILILISKSNFSKHTESTLNYSVLKNKIIEYETSSVYEKMFGIGHIEEDNKIKSINIDCLDIFYSHGIIGYIIIIGTYFLIIYKVLINSKKLNYENYIVKLSIFLTIFLSLLTGQIITSLSASIIVTLIIIDNAKRDKKDLLFATVDFEIGGIETSLINLLNQFDYKKYNITVVLEEKKGLLIGNVNKNVSLEEVKVSNNKNVIIRKINNAVNKLIFTIINYNNYDFGCCYATYSLSSNKLARISSKNTAFYIHSNYKYIYNKEKFQQFFDSRSINEFRKIIFVAEEAKNDFQEFYPNQKEKFEVFANFIDVDMIVKKSKENIDVKKPKNKKLLVFIGRLDDHAKKISRAINLIKEIDDLSLWIIGDGPDRKMYEEEVKKYNLENLVTFFGKKENPYPYMNRADYVILTSDYEGFPLIYLEAIVLKKEIITTIDVSDSQLNIGRDFAHIISKDKTKMITEVKEILKSKNKIKNVDFKKLQKEKFKYLERIFNYDVFE